MKADPNDEGRTAAAAARMTRVVRLPERPRLQRLVDDMEPGGRLLRIRRLRGGITSRASAFRYLTSDGVLKDAVLRIATPGSHSAGPEDFEREATTLRALSGTTVPAPLPMLVDADGKYFGMAAIVLSRRPGKGPVTPARRSVFLDDLARALAVVHRVSLDGGEFAHLPSKGEREVRAELAEPVSGELAQAPLGSEVWGRLQKAAGDVRWSEPCLTHQDFWPGNTLWSRGRLSGVVDWATAAVGDARRDVAQCRVDLAMMYGLDWADDFKARYEGAAGCRLGSLAFWDLYTAKDALVSVPFYLAGYRDLGLSQLTTDAIRRRLHDFIDATLAQA